jgi:uncharacterized membrane protein YwaF
VVAVVLRVNDAGLQVADCWGCYVSPLSFFFAHYAAFASATSVLHSPRLKPTARNIRLSIFASFSSFPVSQGLIMLIVAGVLIIVLFLASVLRLDAGMISLSELASMRGDIILQDCAKILFCPCFYWVFPMRTAALSSPVLQRLSDSACLGVSLNSDRGLWTV